MSGGTLLCCLVSDGSVTWIMLRWRSRLVWKVLSLIWVLRLRRAVVMTCMLVWTSLWLLMWQNLFLVSMCSSCARSVVGTLLTLLRNNALEVVRLKWLMRCWRVLAKVLVLRLKSLDLSSLVGTVVAPSVMKGFRVCCERWRSVWVISLPLALALLAISMRMWAGVMWLTVWKILCTVGELLSSLGLLFLV